VFSRTDDFVRNAAEEHNVTQSESIVLGSCLCVEGWESVCGRRGRGGGERESQSMESECRRCDRMKYTRRKCHDNFVGRDK
jgi:hypothetical protein